mgnify:CR=1 FL=1
MGSAIKHLRIEELWGSIDSPGNNYEFVVCLKFLKLKSSAIQNFHTEQQIGKINTSVIIVGFFVVLSGVKNIT